MTPLTRQAADVFAPTTLGGDVRGADMAEAATWGTEIERALGLITDAPFPASFGSTPVHSFSINVGGYPTSSMIPAGVPGAIAGAIWVPATYTQQPWPAYAVGAYIVSENGNETGVQNSSSAIFGFSGSGAEHVNPYGFNVVASNSPAVTSGTGTGHDFSGLTGGEIDLNIQKIGTSAPTGTAFGLKILGGSEVQPTGGSHAIDILPLGIYAGIPWTHVLYVPSGAAEVGALFGAATATGTNVASMPLAFVNLDGSGAPRASTFGTTAEGGFSLHSGTTGARTVIDGPLALPSANVGSGSAWSIDQTTAPVTIANGANQALPAGAGGLVLISDNTTGDTAIYFASAGSCALISDLGGTFVAPTTTPGAGKSSLAYSSGAYRIYNGTGASHVYSMFLMKTNGG